MDRSASIFSPALPEHLRVALDDALRRWRECGASDRQRLIDYLVDEADGMDEHAVRVHGAVLAMEERGDRVPDDLRRSPGEARAWAETDRALAGLATALEAALGAPPSDGAEWLWPRWEDAVRRVLALLDAAAPGSLPSTQVKLARDELKAFRPEWRQPIEATPAGLAAFERLEWLIARSPEPLRQAWRDFLEAREAAPEVTE